MDETNSLPLQSSLNCCSVFNPCGSIPVFEFYHGRKADLGLLRQIGLRRVQPCPRGPTLFRRHSKPVTSAILLCNIMRIPKSGRPSGASVLGRQSVSNEGWAFAAGLDRRGSTVSERIPSLQPALARRSAPNAPQQAAGKQRADEAYAPRARIHDRHIRPGPGRILVGNS